MNVQSYVEQLDQCGMVHIKGLLPAPELAEIRKTLLRLHSQFDVLKNADDAKIDKAGDIREIARLVNRDSTFTDSTTYARCWSLAAEIFGRTPIYGHDEAIFKSPGSRPVDWHQDQWYSKLDRDKQCISIWIPLQDTGSDNGGMQYVTNVSNKLMEHTQVSPDSFMYRIDDKKLENYESTSPQTNLGDVCVHTPMSIHRSHPNDSDSLRVAWILQFNKFGKLRFMRWSNIKRYLSI